jgi:hypothetical protein
MLIFYEIFKNGKVFEKFKIFENEKLAALFVCFGGAADFS